MATFVVATFVVLSHHETRKLTKNLECSFQNNLYQIITETQGRRLKYAAVTVTINVNGEVSIWYKNKKLKFRTIDRNLRTNVESRKTLDKVISKRKAKKYKPSADHPWRQWGSKPVQVSQHNRKSLNW